MKIKAFNEIIQQQLEACANVLVVKGQEYAPGESACGYDRLSDFKRAATIQGVTPKQALLGMMTKHIISIYRMVEDCGRYDESVWNEKITDAMNYLLILRALIREEKETERQTVAEGISTEEMAARMNEVARVANKVVPFPVTCCGGPVEEGSDNG